MANFDTSNSPRGRHFAQFRTNDHHEVQTFAKRHDWVDALLLRQNFES